MAGERNPRKRAGSAVSRRLSRRKGDTGDEGVNLSPLIDMTFLLLIFFVVSSTLVDDTEILIERPGASSAEKSDSRAIRVTVSTGGQVSINGQAVFPWMVEAELRGLLPAHANGRVLVVVDRRVDAELLVDVVDQARLAGSQHVAVAVDEKENAR